MGKVFLTVIPLFNSVVIKQEGVRFFISAKDSIIIDRAGLIRLIEELAQINFITPEDLSEIVSKIGLGHED